MSPLRSVVFLSGGVGGARLLHGMAQVLPAEVLTAIVNTGDDFEHWGLSICPDLDTVMYTLGGLADETRGWGLLNETFRARGLMERYGAAAWFALGDQDLATHIMRSQALREGATLTAVTARLSEAVGVRQRILPMCDGPRHTMLDTFEFGPLPFQEWLVKHGAPSVRAVRFVGETRASSAVHHALEHADLVVIGPSNPYVSIDPILTLTGVRERLAQKCVVALSPIVAGRAVKGPLADMVRTLSGLEPSPEAIVAHYQGLVRGMVVEEGDASSIRNLPVHATHTIMGGAADRARLAREVLAFAERLR
jgi:LPPG:FO 2-phospho-L-lactate transferase